MPLIVIQTTDSQKYLKPNLEAEHIESWVKEFKVTQEEKNVIISIIFVYGTFLTFVDEYNKLQEGKVQPYKKSEPIPEQNNEPVKVVVADTLQEIVFDSGKNGA